MPTFQFEAMDATGAEIRDVIEAATEEEAQGTKREIGLFFKQEEIVEYERDVDRWIIEA